MKKLLIVFLLLTGCSLTNSTHETKVEVLDEQIELLKLELRKIRLEKLLNKEEKEY